MYVLAIQGNKLHEYISELRRFLSMSNQFSKFIPHLSEISKPLHDLLSTKNTWTWGTPQNQSLQKIKQLLSSTPVLAFYHPNRPTTVSANSSSYGLGPVLTQQQPDSSWRPVAYCSRSPSVAEQHYVQIEKEALASTWACECFSDYIYLIGSKFHLETDHKRLVSLLGSKNLELAIRL